MFLGIPASQCPDAPQYPDKRLAVCGGARCVWDDLAPLAPEIRGGGMHIMAVNDVGMHIPLPVHHWFSNGAEELANWARNRRRGYQGPAIRHSLRRTAADQGAHYYWPWPGHGTSSLNACYTGLAMGYRDIILCGVPLDDSGHYFDPPWVKTTFDRQVPDREDGMKWWANAARHAFDGRVHSQSGRTRELLGAP